MFISFVSSNSKLECVYIPFVHADDLYIHIKAHLLERLLMNHLDYIFFESTIIIKQLLHVTVVRSSKYEALEKFIKH